MGEQFSRIVGSPAFMAIVLADSNAKNITIKIPFQVLNLTISPPITDTPTQYFPCTTLLNHTVYTLGRAFLQAAFVGFDFENSLTYIAQAPGPDMEQSIVKTYHPTDENITRNSLGTYASSWKAFWKVLDNNNASTPSSGLSGGEIAGVVAGSLLLALGILAAVIFMRRMRKRRARNATAGARNATAAPPLNDQSMDTGESPSELANWVKPSEVHGNAPPHELAGQNRVEAPDQLGYSELPIDRALKDFADYRTGLRSVLGSGTCFLGTSLCLKYRSISSPTSICSRLRLLCTDARPRFQAFG